MSARRRWSVGDVECESLGHALEMMAGAGETLFAELLPGDPEPAHAYVAEEKDGSRWVEVPTLVVKHVNVCPSAPEWLFADGVDDAAPRARRAAGRAQ